MRDVPVVQWRRHGAKGQTERRKHSIYGVHAERRLASFQFRHKLQPYTSQFAELPLGEVVGKGLTSTDARETATHDETAAGASPRIP